MILAIEKVRDHPNLAAYGHFSIRILAETVGHGGHAVGLVDAERGGFGVRRIAADQRHVGSVKRRDHTRDFLDTRRRENLFGQIRRGRVRNRVVGVDDIEIELTRHLDQLVGQRQQDTAARGTTDTQGSARRETQPGLEIPERNGGSVLTNRTSCPRLASTFASSVATIPLPPTDP